MSLIIAIAGTTERTLLCAQTIAEHPQLMVCWVLTPAPKPVNRDQTLTENPVHRWANSSQIPRVLIEKKIDEAVKKEVKTLEKPDFLLVVDFGYLVPPWLLELPTQLPLNIHPSALPKWRGSSPGQFVLLTGETTSAVSVIEMTPQFDQGPILWQTEFTVQPNWTQTEYYQHSFELVAQYLPQLILDLAAGQITPQPQPPQSPTPLAKQLSKQDSFVKWVEVKTAMSGKQPATAIKGVDLNSALHLERASRAYSPWPLLWTKIPTAKGPRRMQILKTHLENGQLALDTVKIEGLAAKPWPEIKNIVK